MLSVGQVTEKVIDRDLGHFSHCVKVSIRSRLFLERRSECRFQWE